jgi:general nucleoside transport system permease protein
MSTSTETGTGGAGAPSDFDTTQSRRKALSNKRYRILVAVALGLVVLSAIRVFSDASDLTSGGTIGAALSLAVPIGMAGLGGLWAERAGVVNIGLEGMMILGTFGAGWIGWQHGAWLGVLAAVVFGVLGGLVHAVATITFGVDHIVSGVAVNILGLGVTQFLASVLLEGTPGGGESQSPRLPPLPSLSIPGFDDFLLSVERHGWFLISDVAGIVRGLTTNISVLTLVAIALVIGSYYLLWQTPFGLRLRSCGEDPYAAESLGVRVYLHKYIAVLVSGGLAGFAGAYLAIVAAGIYREGQTGGRGYIGLAAMIFGNWRPGGLVAGAGLFGYTDAMQLRNAAAVHALLLVIAAILAAVVILSLVRRRYLAAGIGTVVGVLAVVWYVQTDVLPDQITFMTPYITTLLVLALASQHLRMPKADGLIYRRGGSH